MCACWPLIDEVLASRNAKLSYVFGASPAGIGRPRSWITSIRIATDKASPGKKKTHTVVAARYCPFCGIRVTRVSLDRKKAPRSLDCHYDKAFIAFANLPITREASVTIYPVCHP